MSNFSNRIDELLMKNHLRRADLVRGTGLKESTIRNWSIESRKPSVEGVLLIAKFFNMTVEELWTGEKPETVILAGDEKELLELYHSFDLRDKTDLLDNARTKAKHYSDSITKLSNIG